MRELTVALLAFIDTDGRILLNRRNDSILEAWELIGGSLEFAEDPMHAIKREIQEELNYMLTQEDELTFVKELRLKNNSLSAHVYFFQARYPGDGHFSDSPEVSVSDLKFFTHTAARELPLLPISREILQGDTM